MKTDMTHLTVQWHITTNCGNKCKHCYMYEEATYEQERRNALDLRGLISVLDRFEDFEKSWPATFSHFIITGGDPLLMKDWKELLTELKRRGRDFSLMGNPETLTERNVAQLADLGVQFFQMSLDGLETKHDDIRSEGSFQRTTKALELLEQHGIRSNIMFTLYPSNQDEFIPLMRYVTKNTCASSFSFDVGCFVGNATTLENSFTRKDLLEIFAKYIDEKQRLKKEGYPLRFGEKPNLLKLVRFENCEFYPVNRSPFPVISGCYIGWTSISVLSDGTVLACRRMPLSVGKLPEQSFEEVFLGSELLRKFRRPESFEECGKCDFYKVCRGCPANVYSLTGDPFSKNPLCFRENIQRRAEQPSPIFRAPALFAGFEEEFQLVASRFSTALPSRVREFAEDREARYLYLDLAYEPTERRRFLDNPTAYLEQSDWNLKDESVVFLMHHFANSGDEEASPEGFSGRLAANMVGRILDEIFDDESSSE